MIDPMWQIIIVMIGAGVFGGLVNYYLSKPDDVPTPSKTRSIFVGTAASLLVPLFLNMISSNLIDQIKAGDTFKLLIFLGFCLVAAISPTAFIRTISDRVLTEAQQAKVAAQAATAQVAQVQHDLQPIVAKETEQDEPPAPAASTSAVAAPAPQPSSDEERLLRALAEGNWALRSQSGLARELNLDRDEIGRLLDTLAQRGLVDKRATRNGIRWFITDQGRAGAGKP